MRMTDAMNYERFLLFSAISCSVYQFVGIIGMIDL